MQFKMQVLKSGALEFLLKDTCSSFILRRGDLSSVEIFGLDGEFRSDGVETEAASLTALAASLPMLGLLEGGFSGSNTISKTSQVP